MTYFEEKEKKVCCDISQLCRDKEQDKWQQNIIATFKTMSQQKMRRIPEETLEDCHDIEMIVTTKQRVEGKKNVAT